jgi:pimeloyl-ACP methyl ester carboxylesterase
MKKLIHFAHANGFPGACYRKLYGYLAPHFDITYVDIIGHHPDYPVTDNWEHLVKELIADIEKQQRQPVIGVGHSLGGVLHFLASQQRPDLYQAVVMLDAPVLDRVRSAAVRVMKMVGMIDKITPAGRTKYRRQSWSSTQAAIEYLQTKALFADFDPECLSDYVNFGMQHLADGSVQLRFDRDIEYRIYRTLPHHLGRYRQQPIIATGLLYGKTTNVILASDIHYMQKNLHIHTQVTNGGHLFPFEFPMQTATDLTTLITHVLLKESSQ